jgi:hypothetical protein
MRSAVEFATLQLEEEEKERMLGESLRLSVATTKFLCRSKNDRIGAILRLNELSG